MYTLSACTTSISRSGAEEPGNEATFGHRSVPAVPFPFRWEGLHSGRATNSYKIEQISTTDGRKEKQ